jgi:hypothetical protein
MDKIRAIRRLMVGESKIERNPNLRSTRPIA